MGYKLAPALRRPLFDAIDIDVQEPKKLKEEKVYLDSTVKETYDLKEESRTRLLELFHYYQHTKEYRTIHDLFCFTEKPSFFRFSQTITNTG